MNSLKQHIPGFIEINGEPKEYQFKTTEELLALPIVKKQMEWPGFSHLAISGNILTGVFHKGARWYVIGYLKYPDKVTIPKWIE